MKRTLTAAYLFFVFILGFASCEKDEFVSEYAQRVPAPVNPFLQPGDSLQSSDSRPVPVIAHRGCWSGDSLPQNSLASFRKALELNIYGTEFDVRQTKDGKLVINHDATFHGLSIASNTYSYLCQYTLTNGETIPLLEDFIKAYLATDSKVLMVVELKSCKVNDVINMLEHYQLIPNVLFISLSNKYCNQLVQKGYGPITCYLGGNMAPADVKKERYGGIDYSQSVFTSHPEWISEAKSLGLWLGAWTVNRVPDIQKYIADNVIVTTDYPGKVAFGK
ncbi:MAG: glycerophosphodiester phosphodiesterase [Prevotella sp.]|nr:glycerophosphodiester phosphodiesterase [Prevotella sp.]